MPQSYQEPGRTTDDRLHQQTASTRVKISKKQGKTRNGHAVTCLPPRKNKRIICINSATTQRVQETPHGECRIKPAGIPPSTRMPEKRTGEKKFF
jgi:peptide methionine sulfoxide reductase MsrB